MLVLVLKTLFFCHKSITYEPVFFISLFGRFYFMHSLRSKCLPNLKKKSRRFFLKMKKVRATLRKISENFSKSISNFFDFQNFWMIFFYRSM